MAQCTQCNNNALYNWQGHLLCLNCYHKIKQIDYVDYIKAATAANHAIEELDYMASSYGVVSNSPKHQIPNFPQFLQQSNPMTYQYINVQNSSVGAINTGNIENIDVSMSNLMNSGNANIAENIKAFTEAIIDSNKLNDTNKNELLEQLSFISTQIIQKKEKRRNGLVKPILEGISGSLQGSAALIEIWDKLYPLISPFFQ